MADTIIQLIIVIIGSSALLLVRYRTGVWTNPITVLLPCFFLPLFFSLFRLSSLQTPEWDYETYVAILTAIGAWLLFPTLLLAAIGRLSTATSVRTDEWIAGTAEFTWCVRIFSLIVFVSYLVGNYIQAHTVLPILKPEIAYVAHTEFPPIIRFFARANPVAVVLLYLIYRKKRKFSDLLLLLVIFITPLTRLSRIDLALALVALCVTFAFYPLFQWTKKRIILVISVLIALLIGGAELGNQRTNRFGVYDVKYDTAIEWKPNIKGPANILPIAYGYFPLSFENFDRFVIAHKNSGSYTFGAQSFDWLFTGFIKLHWIPIRALRRIEAPFVFTPISTAANVPTALYPFYADFGAIGMAFPMILYASLWVFFFYRSRNSLCYSVLFAIYSGAFALSSFQAIIAAPIMIHQVVEVFLLFGIARRLATYNQSGFNKTNNTP